MAVFAVACTLAQRYECKLVGDLKCKVDVWMVHMYKTIKPFKKYITKKELNSWMSLIVQLVIKQSIKLVVT